MSRKPGDGKKVILGRGAIDYDFPPDSVWVSYESKIGRKLSSALRDKLTVSITSFPTKLRIWGVRSSNLFGRTIHVDLGDPDIDVRTGRTQTVSQALERIRHVARI